MATTQAPRTLRDFEETVGVDPIDVLQADRRAVIEELAPLRAKYGPGGTWDARRKAFRSAVANEIAMRLVAERSKAPSETELERLAAGDERVLRWLDDVEQEMARYHLLEDHAQSMTELINRGQAILRYASNEPRA